MTVVGENTSVPASETSYAVCMDYPIVFEAAQGWQCPICKNVYAPWICECLHCAEKKNKPTWTACTSPATVESRTMRLETYSCWHLNQDGHEECWGTKEREECHCLGIKSKCNKF